MQYSSSHYYSGNVSTQAQKDTGHEGPELSRVSGVGKF